MTSSRRGAALLLVAAFVFGALVGGAALAVAGRSPGRPVAERHSPVARLSRDLGLTAAQEESVSAILKRYHPEFQAVRDRIGRDIRGVLTPEQRFSYDSLLAAKRAADSLRRLKAPPEKGPSRP